MLERPTPAPSDTGGLMDWALLRLAEECGHLIRQCQQAEALFGHGDLLAMRGAQTFAELTALLSQSVRECGSWH
jgi:hypothetical protein